MAAKAGALPFAQQIAYFRKKVSVKTRAWTDLYGAEHNQGFMVAGAARDDLLADLRGAVDKAISQGTTLAEFRKDFKATVAKHGWAYNGGFNWRTRIIYETNLHQSYNAGREAQMADPELRKVRPYALYRHADGEAHPRPMHLAWDGTVLPLDDPWWDTHSPANGYGCKCKKFMLGDEDLARRGLKVADKAPPVEWEEKTVGVRGPSPRKVRVPKGIDPGFEYRPSLAAQAKALTPRQMSEPLPLGSHMKAAPDALPAPRPVPASRQMAAGLQAEDYVTAFLQEFGASPDKPVYYTDKANGRLLITDQLFRDRAGRLKVMKRGRERQVLLIADAIREPDEIWEQWVDIGEGMQGLQRVYLAQFLLPGSDAPILAAYEVGRYGWVGVTAYSPDEMQRLLKNRQGVRVYRRK